MYHFILLLRLRTLPLAVSVIILGNALAFVAGSWRPDVFLLSLLTALLLQILSNVANDYGDGIRGTDNDRPSSSPKRLTASGFIRPQQIKGYIFILIILCLISGGGLIAISLREASQIVLFVLLGLLSIAGAIFYTIGKYPYGYWGLGEVSVFLFFGLIGVMGSYALQHGVLYFYQIFPASALGLLCAGVLNVNNMRDVESDKRANKNTIAVRLGFNRAKILHGLLLISVVIFLLIFHFLTSWKSAFWLILLPVFYQHGRKIFLTTVPEAMNEALKPAVLLCFFTSLLLSLGLILMN